MSAHVAKTDTYLAVLGAFASFCGVRIAAQAQAEMPDDRKPRIATIFAPIDEVSEKVPYAVSFYLCEVAPIVWLRDGRFAFRVLLWPHYTSDDVEEHGDELVAAVPADVRVRAHLAAAFRRAARRGEHGWSEVHANTMRELIELLDFVLKRAARVPSRTAHASPLQALADDDGDANDGDVEGFAARAFQLPFVVEPRTMRVCASCFTVAAASNLSACARCRGGAYYCGRACQAAHWSAHRRQCPQMRAERFVALRVPQMASLEGKEDVIQYCSFLPMIIESPVASNDVFFRQSEKVCVFDDAIVLLHGDNADDIPSDMQSVLQNFRAANAKIDATKCIMAHKRDARSGALKTSDEWFEAAAAEGDGNAERSKIFVVKVQANASGTHIVLRDESNSFVCVLGDNNGVTESKDDGDGDDGAEGDIGGVSVDDMQKVRKELFAALQSVGVNGRTAFFRATIENATVEDKGKVDGGDGGALQRNVCIRIHTNLAEIYENW